MADKKVRVILEVKGKVDAQQLELLNRHFRTLQRSLGQVGVEMKTVSEQTERMRRGFRGLIGSIAGFHGQWRGLVWTIVRAEIVFRAMMRLWNAYTSVVRMGLTSIEDYKMTLIALAATETSLLTARIGSMRTAQAVFDSLMQRYKDAYLTIQQIAAAAPLTGEQVSRLVQVLIAYGQNLDFTNEKVRKGIMALANAIAVLTRGQRVNLQITQEVRALMTGVNIQHSELYKLLIRTNPELEKQLKIWIKTGTVAEHLADMFKGFTIAGKEMMNTIKAQWTTFESLFRLFIAKPAFKYLYDSVINAIKGLRSFFFVIDESTGRVERLTSAGEAVKDVFFAIATATQVAVTVIANFIKVSSALAGAIMHPIRLMEDLKRMAKKPRLEDITVTDEDIRQLEREMGYRLAPKVETIPFMKQLPNILHQYRTVTQIATEAGEFLKKISLFKPTAFEQWQEHFQNVRDNIKSLNDQLKMTAELEKLVRKWGIEEGLDVSDALKILHEQRKKINKELEYEQNILLKQLELAKVLFIEKERLQYLKQRSTLLERQYQTEQKIFMLRAKQRLQEMRPETFISMYRGTEHFYNRLFQLMFNYRTRLDSIYNKQLEFENKIYLSRRRYIVEQISFLNKQISIAKQLEREAKTDKEKEFWLHRIQSLEQKRNLLRLELVNIDKQHILNQQQVTAEYRRQLRELDLILQRERQRAEETLRTVREQLHPVPTFVRQAIERQRQLSQAREFFAVRRDWDKWSKTVKLQTENAEQAYKQMAESVDKVLSFLFDNNIRKAEEWKENQLRAIEALKKAFPELGDKLDELAEKVETRYKLMVNGIIDALKAAIDGLKQAFEDVFNTLFENVMKGKLGSFKDYLVMFLTDIARALDRALATHLTTLFASHIAPWLAGLLGLKVKKQHEGGLVKKYHYGGLAYDEVPAVLKTGEYVVSRKGVEFLDRINKGQLPTMQPKTPDVHVVIRNETGVPVEARRAEARFDGERYIINVILKNIERNGVLRKTISEIRS